jgi:aldose 1-epimerase
MDDRLRAPEPEVPQLGSQKLLERSEAEPAIAPVRAPEREILPTGRQLELRRGRVRAVVTEVGATLRMLEVGGLQVLDGFPCDRLPDAGRGQVLIPFPNRVDHGRYVFHGTAQQLPLDETDRGNAMHGLVRWLNWAPVSRAASRLVMALVLHAREGYPFVLSLRVAYTLTPTGLRVRQSVRNLGATPAPYGAGFHPYLTVGTPRIDDVTMRLPARTYFLTNPRLIPIGRATVADTPFDFRLARPLGVTVMDTGFTDLARDRDGLARVELCARDGGPRVTVLLDGGYPFLQVYTGDTLPDAAARRRAIAIEPCTCAPNALNNGLGLRVLEPGGCFSSAFEISATL